MRHMNGRGPASRALSRLIRCAALLALLTGVAAAGDEHGDEHSGERAHEHSGEHGGEHGNDEHAGGHGDEHGHDEHAGEHDDHETTFSVAQLEAYGVVVATAGPGSVDVEIELPGEVRPNADRVAHLGPRFPGVVREVRKGVGDKVRKGEVLARIESDNLSTYNLIAAFDGEVIDRHIALGESVTRATTAFVVADVSTVWVYVDVYQKALPRVTVGQSVIVTTSDQASEAGGVISYLAPVVDQATRTATARVVLDNASGRWRPGLFVVANVSLPVEARVVVTRRALHTLEGNSVVFVIEGDGFVARPVTVGEIGRTKASIVTGVAAGERYADQGSFLVKAELGKGEAAHEH